MNDDVEVAMGPDADRVPGWAALEPFSALDEETRALLAELMEPVRFEDGDEILAQGTTGDDLYVLTRGRVNVRAQSSMHDTMFERTLRAPAVFGEMAIVTREPRTATVNADGPIEAYRLAASAVRDLIATHPASAGVLTAVVGRRLLEADTIAAVGKFRVTGRLGAGAMATVFQAQQPNLDRPVALKMLSHTLVNRPGFAEHFQAEARVVAGLDHDHIVRVLDTVQAYGTHFIVMEKLTGTAMSELIADGIRLDWDAVRRILREILSALEYSHQRGLLHRDIKPSNVFLSASRRVKLLDFGIAVRKGSEDAKTRRLAGTPYYMAPEQIRRRKLDGRCDLYSTGILAYQLITHELPFKASNLKELLQLHLKSALPDPREVVTDLPDDLAEFVLRATRKRRQNRFASCGAAEEFLRIAAERPMVQAFELAQVGISYHPSRRSEVHAAISALQARLDRCDGVRVRVSDDDVEA